MTRFGFLAALLACALVLVVAPPGDLRAGAAFALLWLLPGLAWGLVLGGRWLEAAGLGISLNGLLTLALHYLPGPVLFAPTLAVANLAVLVPILCFRGRAPKLSIARPLPLLLLIALALALRLPSLGYSEFQGDEGVILVRAAAALEGDDQELFLHQKGPVEIVLPMATWRLAGAIEEIWARLPFTWISLLGVLAAFRLGARWFGRTAGLVTGVLLAVNGFHVAFGRIVQYQAVVVLMVLLSLLALDRYRGRGRLLDLVLGVVFLAFGLLAHYDAVLFLPAAAVLVIPRLRHRAAGQAAAIRKRLKQLIIAAGLGCLVLALFYAPYVLNPSFARTAGYVADDRVGAGFHLNLGQLWVMSTVYNASYYAVALGLLLVSGVLIWTTDRSRRTEPWTSAWLALLVPTVFYLVLVVDPRTHVYTVFLGATLLAGATAAAVWQRIGRASLRRLLLAAGAAVFVLSAGYVWIVFVDHTPEYQRTFPDQQVPLFWTTYQQMPLYGRFGFPHRAGWQAISQMVADGVITGVYGSNEEQEITDWYTRQAPRSHCPGPAVYVVAERVQDEIPIDWDGLGRDYSQVGTVWVDGEVRIRWYSRQPVQPIELDGFAYRQWWLPAEVAPPTAGGQNVVDYTLGGLVRLIGYDLDTREAVPGGSVGLTLYWQPMAPIDRRFQVFTHLYDGQMRGQDDSAPECGMNPTTRWETDQVIPDSHRIPIAPDTPAGPVPLLVGMYDLLTLDRLAVPGVAGDAIHLTDVVVQPPAG